MTDGERLLLGALMAVRAAAVRFLIAPTDKRRDALVEAVEAADAELEIELARKRLGTAHLPASRSTPRPAPAPQPPTRLAFPAQAATPPQGTRKK